MRVSFLNVHSWYLFQSMSNLYYAFSGSEMIHDRDPFGRFQSLEGQFLIFFSGPCRRWTDISVTVSMCWVVPSPIRGVILRRNS